MKKLLLLLLAFTSFTTYAQLDREHWFAPMVDRVSSASTINYQSIYMSTNETVPFKVDVYFNNVVVNTVTLSKNNPEKYVISSSERDIIIASERIASETALFMPVSMGIYLKGEKPFYASLRFSITNHGEILTSKGTSGIGKEFRAVMAPITATNGILNFTTGVMATEDNTNVIVSEFSPGLIFSDGVARTQFNFTLNKGQSYIIEGTANHLKNHTGFIGARIVSNKPVSITNGNFNGQYATTSVNSSDILMDQGVPVEKLGQEFVLMKGNGTILSNMEKAIIVATEDLTKIFINGSVAPVTTINTGEYYLTDQNAYILQGSDHYNMHIKTDKNVYVYQLMAGDSGSSMVATGGFNYIPPLSCYLPIKIDEIGRIDENEYTSNGVAYSSTVPTKLNIITARGAMVDVKQNGISLALNALNGPFDVTGNNAWVTYSIPGIYGNVAINSNRAVTAGISAGNDAMGYGGYFAGFSYIPAIIKSEGDCLPGVKLEVTEGFSHYLWVMKVGTAYVPAPGINTTHQYMPTQAGIYAVQIQQGFCPQIQTQDFKFFNCTTYTNYNYDRCTVQEITPAFALSSQSYDPATVVVDTPPTKGTVTKAADGKLTYTANPNATGTDTFKFSFCGTGAIPDCETVQATIHLKQIEKYDVDLYSCSETGTASFNLTAATVTPATDVTKKYYRDPAFSDEIPAGQISAYISTPGFVYVMMRSTFGCTATAVITLKIENPPTVDPAAYTQTHCDEDMDGIIDGVYKVNLTTVTPKVLQNPNNFTVRYYADQSKATAGGFDNITGIFTFSGNTSVWIRVDSPKVCAPVIKEILLKIGAKAPLITQVATKEICDVREDISEVVSLSDYVALFTTASGSAVTYYNTLTEAENNSSAINTSQTLTADRTFYYRIDVPGFCESIGNLKIVLKKGTPSTTLPESVTVCQGATTTLDVGSGYSAVNWSTGATAPTVTVGAGNYWVDLTDALGCLHRQFVSVNSTAKPQWDIAAYDAAHCDDDFNGIIKINLSTVTPIILPNHTQFTVEYFADPGFSTPLPNEWTYSAPTRIYVRATSLYCPAESQPIDFEMGSSLPLISANVMTPLCDSDLNNSESIDLAAFTSSFTSDTGVSVKYFDDRVKAQNNLQGDNITTNPTLSGDKQFYYRFSKTGFCDVIGTLSVTFKQPKKSAILTDLQICPETKASLNAGPGFDAYLWSTGDTTPSVPVSVGDYWVDLSFNGCVYRQLVSVKAVELPQITGVDIQGSTVTITVTGGNPPYQYAIDNSAYQPSNVFTNVGGGDHTVSVISADNCIPVTVQLNVIQLYNVITPNGDGRNDVFNYSGLMKKNEPFLEIFDRYGNLVFTGDTANRYSWDGKTAGKTVSTGSYWYVMQWKEPASETISKYTGWVLVKNRD